MILQISPLPPIRLPIFCNFVIFENIIRQIKKEKNILSPIEYYYRKPCTLHTLCISLCYVYPVQFCIFRFRRLFMIFRETWKITEMFQKERTQTPIFVLFLETQQRYFSILGSCPADFNWFENIHYITCMLYICTTSSILLENYIQLNHGVVYFVNKYSEEYWRKLLSLLYELLRFLYPLSFFFFFFLGSKSDQKGINDCCVTWFLN